MSIRSERVGGHIRKEIAEMLIKQEIHDPRLTGFVSITDVRLSSNLKSATVYFSVLEEGGLVSQSDEHVDRVQACQKVLTHAAGFIRSQLNKRLQLRYSPTLNFLPDNALKQGRRIEHLLKSVPSPLAEDGASLPVVRSGDAVDHGVDSLFSEEG